ncbi:cytochrome B [Lewinella sp. JB7]|uniref:cytochrome B n=1 Tax=Lewinella sp. JB7 TaxID=2962887 RepID=UPI0020C9B364|nr:cytochrome B [Lewinella sp. JB7]MCP9236909.1 cytochrome B [Lewinella sp. JB7]
MGVLYTAVQHAHSGLRWVVLILLLAAIGRAASRRRTGEVYPGKDKLALFALISVHIQLLLGLALFLWLSPYGIAADPIEGGGSAVAKYYNYVHWWTMLIAVILITVGYSKAKRQAELNKGWKTIGIYYLVGLLIMLAGIPWPFYPGLESVGWG